MLFGRVHGNAVCTIKYPGTEGLKFLIVQPLNKNMEPIGILQVAADVVQAGPGDLCVMVRSREAALAMLFKTPTAFASSVDAYLRFNVSE